MKIILEIVYYIYMIPFNVTLKLFDEIFGGIGD